MRDLLKLLEGLLDIASADPVLAERLFRMRRDTAAEPGPELGPIEGRVLSTVSDTRLGELLDLRRRFLRSRPGPLARAAGVTFAALGLGLLGPATALATDNAASPPRKEAVAGASLKALDSDGDGLSDDDEVNIHGTDPLLEDTDGDGLLDGWEVTYLVPTDPLVADGLDPLDDGTSNPSHGADGDPDADGWSNLQEYYASTDPTDPSSSPEMYDMPAGIPGGEGGCTPVPSLPVSGGRAAAWAIGSILAASLVRLRRRWRDTEVVGDDRAPASP